LTDRAKKLRAKGVKDTNISGSKEEKAENFDFLIKSGKSVEQGLVTRK